MSNKEEDFTVPVEDHPNKPIKPFVYLAFALVGVLVFAILLQASHCGRDAQSNHKSSQQANPTAVRPDSMEGYTTQQQADIARLSKQATDTRAVLAKAQAAYNTMTNRMPCDPSLSGTLGRSADGQPIVCGADGMWQPVAVQSTDPIQANPAADASARHKQAAVDNARQAKEEDARRKLAALQASTVAIDFSDRGSATTAAAPQPARVQPVAATATVPPSNTAQSEPHAVEPVKPKYAWNEYVGKTYKIPEGTIFETVLTNRVNGSASGPINTMFTTDIWSHDHQQLLIPQGTRCLGTVGGINSGTQQRLYVAFHRCIMPDLYSIDLDKFAGLNQIGEVGLRDQVNHHYLQIFGASLAVGAVAGIAQIGNSTGGFGYDPSVAIRNGVSQSLAQESIHILDKFLNQLPTFTIRERARVKIYLTADLDVPSYDAHRVDPAL